MRRTAVALCLLTLLASCTSNARSVSSEPTTPAPYYPRYGAPAVSEPLDAGSFATDPCDSLTASQQAEFGVDSGAQDREHDGESCTYLGEDGLSLFVFFSNRPSGLSFLYAMNDGGSWSYWTPMAVDDRPAVVYAGPQPTASCHVGVGLSDTKYFSTGTTADKNTDICESAKSVAAAVLATVEAGR